MTDPKIIEACARAAHETNRAYCAALGDTSVPTWKEATSEHKESLRKGVVVALAGATHEEQHEAWCAEKRATGWVYGPIKDPARKLHPCMVPYASLPPEQRAKDTLFLGTVRCMAAALGATVTYPADGEYPKRTIDWSQTWPRAKNDDRCESIRVIDLGNGVKATATPVDTDAGPAFKIEPTVAVLNIEAPVGAHEANPGSGVHAEATPEACRECGHVDPASRVDGVIFRCTACGYERRWIGCW